MTITTYVLKANTVADLTTAVNALFAAWIAGASRKVLGVSVILNDSERLLGTEYQVVITTNDTGATSQADPYVFAVAQEKSATELQASLDALIALDATAFWTGARVISQDIPSRINLLTAWIISAATASVTAATANWTPR